MIKKDFDVFANRYRLILEKGVKNYPEYYSKSTMLEYDRFIYESKKSLKKSNLLEGWRMPSISYIHPLQLVEKSLLSESHYIAINKLDEGIFDKVGGYIQRGMGRLFGAGSSDKLKTQAGEADLLSNPPPGAAETDVGDQALGQLRIKHKSFRDQLGAVIALKNWSQKKTGTEPFWGASGKEKDVFDSELAAIEKEIREALPQIEQVAPLAEALSSRNRLARLSEVAITQGLFEGGKLSFVGDTDSVVPIARATFNNIQNYLRSPEGLDIIKKVGSNHTPFIPEPDVARLATQYKIDPEQVRGIAHLTTIGSRGATISVNGDMPASVVVSDAPGQPPKIIPVPPPNPPVPEPTPTPGPDHPPAPPGRPGPEHPPAPHTTDPHAPPDPHAPDGGGHHAWWAGLATIVALGATYGGFAMRDRRKRLEALIAVKRYDETTPAVVLPPAPPEEVAELPATAEIKKAEEKEEVKGITPETITGEIEPVEPAVVAPVEAPKVEPDGKTDIYVYKGKDGQGFQSRVAQKINKIPGITKDDVGKYQATSSKVMKALATDLTNTNKFKVLEEGRDIINLASTLAILDTVKEPAREILRSEIVALLRKSGVAANSTSLKKGAGPEVSVEPEPAKDVKKPEAAKKVNVDKILALTVKTAKGDDVVYKDNEKEIIKNISTGKTVEELQASLHDQTINHGWASRGWIPKILGKAIDDEIKKDPNSPLIFEYLRRLYSQSKISLNEYNNYRRYAQTAMLKEQIKRQILSTRK